MYLKEKARFDRWAGDQGLRKKSAKRAFEDDSAVGPAPKRPRVSEQPGDMAPATPFQHASNHNEVAQSGITAAQNDLQELGLLRGYDNQCLYNINPNNGEGFMVGRQDLGSGSVPEWWRAARMQQLTDAGICLDGQVLASFFDEGHDVGPNPYNQGSYFILPGNFVLDPAPSPPPRTPTNNEFAPADTDIGLDFSGYGFTESAFLNPNFAAVDPALLTNNGGVTATGEQVPGDVLSFGGFDDENDFQFMYDNAVGPYGGTAGPSTAVLTEQPTHDTLPPDTADNGVVVGPSRRTSPRHHDKSAPHRRSPRNHSNSSQ
jgi:hypothetical protein